MSENSTIWKFNLSVTDEQRFPMPRRAEILTAQQQSGWLCIWAKVDPKAPKVDRVIRIAGTGGPLCDGKYVASVQQGALVWHIFDGGEEPVMQGACAAAAGAEGGRS